MKFLAILPLISLAAVTPVASSYAPSSPLFKRHGKGSFRKLVDKSDPIHSAGILQSSNNRSSPSAATSLRAGGEGISSQQPSLKKQMLAEFLGTMLLVQIGCGAVCSDIFGGAFSGLFQVAAAWIIAVTLAIATTGPISGAHLNPAMSIAFAVVRKDLPLRKLLGFIFAQIGGAATGAFVNLLLYGKSIQSFEAAQGIVRGAASGVASAKAFGEYFA